MDKLTRNEIELIASQLWARSRADGLLNSETATENLVGVIDAIQSDAVNEINSLRGDLLVSEAMGRRMVKVIRRTSECCPVCNAAHKVPHTHKCWLRTPKTLTWTTLMEVQTDERQEDGDD